MLGACEGSAGESPFAGATARGDTFDPIHTIHIMHVIHIVHIIHSRAALFGPRPVLEFYAAIPSDLQR